MTALHGTSTRSRATGTRKRFSPLRDLPAVLWLLAVVLVALVHRDVTTPRWLLFHLLLLGAVTHSILVWSQHFTDALLHSAPSGAAYRNRSVRLFLCNTGAVVVVSGVLAGHWRLAATGASAVALAVGWHAVALFAQLRRALGSRFACTVRYYVASAALLPLGAFFGVLMVRGLPGDWHQRVLVAHVAVNVLGWMGITVLGTLVTLWPTMLRTRIAESAEQSARRALPLLLGGIVLVVSGCLVGLRPLTGVGFLVYAGAMGLLARPFVRVARTKPPLHFATWSVAAAVAWLAGLVTVLGVGTFLAPTWMDAHMLAESVTPGLAVGFGAQVLLGALSYLVPVVAAAGPTSVRAANLELDRGGALRVAATNAGVLVFLLPSPSMVRVVVSVLVLGALATFLPLMFRAVWAAHRARQTPACSVPGVRRRGPAPVAADRPKGQRTGLAVTGIVLVVLAVSVGVALDPGALAGARHVSSSDGVIPTGRTTHVEVIAANMRFTPDTVQVPAGNRLVIELKNADSGAVHDLVLDSGADSGRLSPGQSVVLDVGVIGRDIEGWCSLVGHRQMGMVFHVHVTGLHQAGHGNGDRGTFRVSDVQAGVAPGVTQRLWPYNGTLPGPTMHGRVGDRFVIRLVNDTPMGHSIDFHAGQVAPDRAMRTLAPGQSLVYRFTAHHAGIWLYHCSTMPMSVHIANGMFGAVVIDPPDLPKVARSYLLVQSELYLGTQGGSAEWAKVAAGTPDAVVFNGYADQYDHRQLTARVGQRIRIWVLDAGPDRPSAFHVVGGQFDTVFAEGTYLLRRDSPRHGASQVLPLGPGQGGFVELSFRRSGHYPFVSHLMVDAERGAHGVLHVTP